jgi:hypothetical protein
MINNLDATGVREKVSAETGGNAAVKAIFDRVSASPGAYGIDPAAGGLEFMSTTTVKDHPNRCHFKVWQPARDRLLAWFYKRSAVPHSRDRFSYGGIVWDLGKADLSKVDAEVDTWLVWLDSGLNPEKRPSGWIGAFSYDIPE